MRTTILAVLLLVAGCAGLNSPGGILRPDVAKNVAKDVKDVSDFGNFLSNLGIPYVGYIASAIAAMGGGIILIDKAVAIRKNKNGGVSK